MSEQGKQGAVKTAEKPKGPSEDELRRRGDETESEARMQQPVDRHQDPNSGVVARGHRVKMKTGGKYYGPGEVVTGTPKDIANLRKRGVLVSADPVYSEKAGPLVLQEDAAAKGAKEG